MKLSLVSMEAFFWNSSWIKTPWRLGLGKWVGPNAPSSSQSSRSQFNYYRKLAVQSCTYLLRSKSCWVQWDLQFTVSKLCIVFHQDHWDLALGPGQDAWLGLPFQNFLLNLFCTLSWNRSPGSQGPGEFASFPCPSLSSWPNCSLRLSNLIMF